MCVYLYAYLCVCVGVWGVCVCVGMCTRMYFQNSTCGVTGIKVIKVEISRGSEDCSRSPMLMVPVDQH